MRSGHSDFHRRIPVLDTSQIGAARRAVRFACDEAEIGDPLAGKAAIVVSEIAANIVRYTGGGEILYRMLDLPAGPVLEILGIDRGLGMDDPELCLSDGYSSRGTSSGNGLGAVQRQSDEFDLYSSVARGTVVMARLAVGDARKRASFITLPLRVGGLSVPSPGEEVCGDAWRVRMCDGGFALMVSDGLGHGRFASEASEAAAGIFMASAAHAPTDMVGEIHSGLRGTRGGTVAVCKFDAAAERLSYCGVGNIGGRIVSDSASSGLVSNNGTAGVLANRLRQFEHPFGTSQTLIMHSDGLQSRWRQELYPGLLGRHPAVIAATLYRDFRRDSDDAAVVAVQWDGSNRDRIQNGT